MARVIMIQRMPQPNHCRTACTQACSKPPDRSGIHQARRVITASEMHKMPAKSQAKRFARRKVADLATCGSAWAGAGTNGLRADFGEPDESVLEGSLGEFGIPALIRQGQEGPSVRRSPRDAIYIPDRMSIAPNIVIPDGTSPRMK
jgi:hypothetical protein